MAAPFVKRIAIDEPSGGLPSGYPYDLSAVRHLGERALDAAVTVFVGENGSGKSTLLEALAVSLGMNAEGGGRNLRFTTQRTHSTLHERLRVTRRAQPRDSFFLRAESFYNVASEIDRLEVQEFYGGSSLHAQSHGESFLTLFLARLGGPGLYLLDEPEAALSPQRQLAVLARMHELAASGSQFVLATHAPILMACPGAEIWQFSDRGIDVTDAADTEHWQILRSFLNGPERMLRELLRDEPAGGGES